MFTVMFVSGIMSFFALGCLPPSKEGCDKSDIFLTWFAMFLSSCLVISILRYLTLWIFS